jgi:type I restriction enzyme, S subunit
VKAEWQKKSLGELLLKTETVNPAATPDAVFEYIDFSSVSNETYEIQETQELKGRDAPSRARRLVKVGDVIFATIRPPLQRIARVPPSLDGHRRENARLSPLKSET